MRIGSGPCLPPQTRRLGLSLSMHAALLDHPRRLGGLQVLSQRVALCLRGRLGAHLVPVV